jgi:general secretion pathway protein F
LNVNDLVALNDELAALVRAGVPLERTLGDMGRDLPGRLGRATTQLAERITAGASLPQALAAMPDAFPPVYRATVEAGMRAGRLSVALEDLARAARRMAELKRIMSLAAIYPLVVVALAYGLFMFFITQILPTIFDVFEGHPPRLVQGLLDLGKSVHLWGPVFPIVALLAAIGLWQAIGRRGLPANRLPIVGRMLADARLASFSEILSLLLDHQVSLPDAIGLAGDASGDSALAVSATRLAAQLRQGQAPGTLLSQEKDHAGLPPFLLWLIATGHQHHTLVALLRHSAEIYRRRALRRSDWLRFYLPTLLTVVIGGMVVMLYGMTLFVPMRELLLHLAETKLR